jgi:hypothetical protein
MESFVEECLDTYERSIKNDINIKFNEIKTNIESQIKSDIMMKLKNSDNLDNYDYNKLPKYDIFLTKFIESLKTGYDFKEFYNRKYIYEPSVINNWISQLEGKLFIPNEKIACLYIEDTHYEGKRNMAHPIINNIKNMSLITKYEHYKTEMYSPQPQLIKKMLQFNYDKNKYCYFDNYIMVTNYGKIYKNDKLIKEYNIWLPLDYIELINLTRPSNIIEIMDKIMDEFVLMTHQSGLEYIIKIQVTNNDLLLQNEKLKNELSKLKEDYISIKEKYDILENKFEKIKQFL